MSERLQIHANVELLSEADLDHHQHKNLDSLLNNCPSKAILDSINEALLSGFQHENLLPLVQNCTTKALLDGKERGREAIQESLEAADTLQFLRGLKTTLQQHYDLKAKTLTITPQLMEQLNQMRAEGGSKAAILDVIGIAPDKFVYIKEELDLARENLNQDIEATNKRLDHAHHKGTEIYNFNMQIIQMLKAVVKGLDNATSAATKRIHR